MEAIRIQLMALLQEQGLSVSALATRIGMDRGNLHRYLSGVRPMSLEVAQAIADGLGYSVTLHLEQK